MVANSLFTEDALLHQPVGITNGALLFKNMGGSGLRPCALSQRVENIICDVQFKLSVKIIYENP